MKAVATNAAVVNLGRYQRGEKHRKSQWEWHYAITVISPLQIEIALRERRKEKL